MYLNNIKRKSCAATSVLCYLYSIPTVRYGSEFVEKDRKIKKRYFRHFIYVNLGILVEPYKNHRFTHFMDKNENFSANFFCPLLDISVSGSPIIQDGKLVGAVTHVLVNDPTTGYGIFIENMLEAAS